MVQTMFCNLDPLAYLTVRLKIIMKVLANRLRNVIGRLVDQEQAGFIKDIFILDNVALTQEVISEVHFNKQHDILLKLEFEKAYER